MWAVYGANVDAFKVAFPALIANCNAKVFFSGFYAFRKGLGRVQGLEEAI